MTVNFLLNKVDPANPTHSTATQIFSVALTSPPRMGELVVLPKSPSGFGVYLVENVVWNLLAAPVVSVYVMETLP